MPLKEALKEYQNCQQCAYVDDCPKREDKIVAAFAANKIDVECENEKEIDIYED